MRLRQEWHDNCCIRSTVWVARQNGTLFVRVEYRYHTAVRVRVVQQYIRYGCTGTTVSVQCKTHVISSKLKTFVEPVKMTIVLLFQSLPSASPFDMFRFVQVFYMENHKHVESTNNTKPASFSRLSFSFQNNKKIKLGNHFWSLAEEVQALASHFTRLA